MIDLSRNARILITLRIKVNNHTLVFANRRAGNDECHCVN